MSNEDEILLKVRNITAGILTIDEKEIKPDSDFQDDLGADSLAIVELVMALEEEFGIEISDEEAESIYTVGDAVEYIKKHQKEN